MCAQLSCFSLFLNRSSSSHPIRCRKKIGINIFFLFLLKKTSFFSTFKATTHYPSPDLPKKGTKKHKQTNKKKHTTHTQSITRSKVLGSCLLREKLEDTKTPNTHKNHNTQKKKTPQNLKESQNENTTPPNKRRKTQQQQQQQHPNQNSPPKNQEPGNEFSSIHKPPRH